MTTRTNDEKFTASFVFYYSFADMISKIPDREIRLQAYEMLFEYALFGTEPQIEHWAVDMVFSAVKPQIDANNKRRKNGKKGGRKSAQEKATQAQTQPEVQAQPTVEVETVAQAQQIASAQTWTETAAQAQVQAHLAVQAQQAAAAQAEVAVQEQQTAPTQPQQQPASSGIKNQQQKIIYFGENQYPTTLEELQKFEALGRKLFGQYHHNSALSPTDVGRILRTFKIKKNVEVTDNGKIII